MKLSDPFPKGTIFPPELHFDDGTTSRAQWTRPQGDERKLKILIPIPPEEFISKLKGVPHPSQLDSTAWGWYPQVIEDISTVDHSEFLRNQARTLKSIIDRAKELTPEEKKRKLNSDPVTRKINDKKRLVLMEELLRSVNHPDMDIVDDLGSGFMLTGWLKPSGVFPKMVVPPHMSRETLNKSARVFNNATIDRCKRNCDPGTNAELVQITLSELEREWITEEVEISTLDEEAILSPRFLIHQGEKSRAIDDLTFSHINSTIGSSERILLQGVDELASMAKQLMKAGLTDLVGRTYDLESAYRQLPVHPADRGKAIIAIFDTAAGKMRAFRMASMPFGAVASVYAFLRTAAAINHLGCSLLGVPMTSYFDDFSILTQRALARGTKLAVETLFEVLGILLSKADKKNLDFAKTFDVLGVSFDLHVQPKDYFEISNTSSRVTDLSTRITHVLDEGKLRPREAKSLRSRLNFANSQLYGRMAAAVLKDLGRYECSRSSTKLDGNTKVLLNLFRSHLMNGLPRRVFFSDELPVHVFTDGSLESDDGLKTGGLGGVLVDSEGNCLSAFSFIPSSSQIEEAGGGIHQLEILPVILACVAFEESLRHRPVYFHVDNTAAQAALINAGSSNHSSNSLVYLFLDLEQKLQFRPWISRVSSHSNIADGPSRGSLEEVESLGAKTFMFPHNVFDLILKEFKNRNALSHTND